MPIYEYRCEDCGAAFEKLATAEAEETACPECGSDGVRRAFSAPAAPQRLVKSPGEARRQERRNAQLRERTKANFKAARQRARDRSGGGAS
jgi:putative FmdB family regulatory protein